jgi:hypothetical protein
MQLRVKPVLGFQATEALTVGLEVQYDQGIGGVNLVQTLKFYPNVTWTVYKNATILLGWNLRYNMFDSKIDENNLKLNLKWSI